MKRCINFILNALYGREYYAVIVGERGVCGDRAIQVAAGILMRGWG